MAAAKAIEPTIIPEGLEGPHFRLIASQAGNCRTGKLTR
jgi:hypothetical protein